VANTLATLARSLEASRFSPEDIFGFLMRSIFTMFAEDVGLLPEGSFTRLLDRMEGRSAIFQEMLESLWTTMAQGGFSPILEQKLLRFNGGLFEDARALPLTQEQIHTLADAARHDWRDVEPAIFGTLVERALDPKERHKLGAHYTPRAYVERLVLPTIIEPLREEWDAAKVEAQTLRDAGKDKQAVECLRTYLRHLCTVRVLDPACGSGNFLYVTLEHMKRLESEVLEALAAFGYVQTGMELEGQGISVSPMQFLGMEINPRAAAIADLVLWIGYLQWHLRTHGGAHPKEPVIEKFHTIEWRDALIEHDGVEPVFDNAGHPPRSLGRSHHQDTSCHRRRSPRRNRHGGGGAVQEPHVRQAGPRPTSSWEIRHSLAPAPCAQALGDGYVEAVRGAYKDLPESIDFVMYWWHLAATKVRDNSAHRFGFITTNSLRQTFNRRILSPHLEAGLHLAFAIPDHPWVDSADGAAVRIAMTVGTLDSTPGHLLRVTNETQTESDAAQVVLENSIGAIHADLTTGANLSTAQSLNANRDIANHGFYLSGMGFLVPQGNLNELGVGRIPGIEKFLRPYRNGRDLTDRPRGVWVIDMFGLSDLEALHRYPEIYQWIYQRVKPARDTNPRESRRRNWWLFGEPNQKLRAQLSGLPRFIATVETSKFCTFQFLDESIRPDHKLVCIALADAYHLGILSSRVHVVFALATGSHLGVGNDPVYVKTKCFDPFPFPTCTPELADKIRQLGERLDAHRKRQQELHPELTMTGMYNVLEALREGRPLTPKEKAIHEAGLVGILQQLHQELDEAVFAAYGWPSTILNAEILERLVALNAQRAAEEANGLIRWLRPEFQNPSATPVAAPAVQEGLDLADAETATPKSKRAKAAKETKLPWPATTREQIQALRTALVFADAALPPDALAKRFAGAKAAQIAVLLEAMSALGQIRETQGRFAA
jgi:hypothetical protein